MITCSDHFDLGRDKNLIKDARDGLRQTQTVVNLLQRFFDSNAKRRVEIQILADEVGMGKTFVALGAAYSVLSHLKQTKIEPDLDGCYKRVLVLTPNNHALFKKWGREVLEFSKRCIAPEHQDSELSFAPQLIERIDDLAIALRKGGRQPQVLVARVGLFGRDKLIDYELKRRFLLGTLFRFWGVRFNYELRERLLKGAPDSWPKDEAKTLEDGTGDSAFFLAIGFLKWKTREIPRPPDPAKDGGKNPKVEKFAPLILVKVSLTDEGKGAPGRRKYRIVPEDEPQDNQSLKAKLKEEWDFNLPALSEGTKASDYLATVKRAITLAKIEGLEVQDTLALGFFNFARYRLWLDLDPKQWGGLAPEDHPIVRSIISVTPLDTSCPPVIDATRDEALADEVARHQEAEDIPIVRDADTSQYTALLYAAKGKSIVIIGPPGSGKSQTITNLVATSIASGKRVLFVAQKLPALDVVASRIRDSGLGDFCLQFYSATRDGANDRRPVSPIEIHQQLTAARNLLGVKPRQVSAERRAPLLAKKLNAYATALHSIHHLYGETVQTILCRALKLKEEAATAWGEHWDEALLTVNLPEASPASIQANRLLGVHNTAKLSARRLPNRPLLRSTLLSHGRRR